MGTRGALGVKLDGQYYVTYNHWDSYPSGLGKEVVQFCQNIQKSGVWDIFREKMGKVTLVNDQNPASAKLQKKYAEFCDTSVSEGTPASWYCLLRKLQGIGILKAIYEGKLSHMIDNFSFLKDSLFCEYAYIINLDDNRLEFYDGFNKDADTNSPLPIPQKPSDKQEKYYPVRFVGSVYLDEIVDFKVEDIDITPALAWRKDD